MEPFQAHSVHAGRPSFSELGLCMSERMALPRFDLSLQLLPMVTGQSVERGVKVE